MFKDLVVPLYTFKDLMAFSFVAWMMRKLPRHLKKFIQGFVVLTNLVPNFIFKGCMDYAKICSACQFHLSTSKTLASYHSFMASWCLGIRCGWTIDSEVLWWTFIYLGYDKLFPQMSWSYCILRSEERNCYELHQKKHHLQIWCTSLHNHW